MRAARNLGRFRVCMGIGEALVESLLEDSGQALSSSALARFPAGRGVDLGGRAPQLYVVRLAAGTGVCRTAAQAGVSPSALLRTWSAS